MIGIIDYGAGNLCSVYNAFKFLDQKVVICDKAKQLDIVDKIVLPGVGSSKDAMTFLKEKGFIEPLLYNIKKGKYFLGICLGLQLLFMKSEEGIGCDCLKIVDGDVKLFPKQQGLKVPQIGWNTVNIKNKDCPILKGIKNNTYFYFVHSYYCDNKGKKYSIGYTEYSVNYTSILWKENIFATQFHPERSQENGLKILKNFGEI